MANFLLNTSPMLTSKTNILPQYYKLNHKPFNSTPNISTKPYSSSDLTPSRPYPSAPISASIAHKEGGTVEVENKVLHNGLRPELIPKHVALIMEKERDLASGRGRGSLIDIARICCEFGIKVLSVYTCSDGNNAQKDGVDFTMNITKSDLEELSRNDIRVSVIGNRKTISESMREFITQLEEATKNNRSLHIIETVNYTGYFDILQSCMALAEKVSDGLLQPEEIDENLFEQELETKFSEYPNPDLVIRTGGKTNFGNFMLWQSAYSEICFVEKDALPFNKTDFIEVLKVYQKRNRRYGGSDKK